MIESSQLLLNTSIQSEVAHAPLGDRRRSARYEDIVSRLERQPDASNPDAMGMQAALEAYYRFVRNEQIEHLELLEPHFDETRQRAEGLDRALVVQDTTEIAFDVHEQPSRDNLAEPNPARQFSVVPFACPGGGWFEGSAGSDRVEAIRP